MRREMLNVCFLYSTPTASVVLWSEFLAADPQVPGSILSVTRYPEKQWVWNGVHTGP
jgi:hypothetical protein